MILSSVIIIPIFAVAAFATDLTAKKAECYGVALILPGGARICPKLLRYDEKLDCCAHTEESRKELSRVNTTPSMTSLAADSALDRFLLRLRRKRCAFCGAGHSDTETTSLPESHYSAESSSNFIVTSTAAPPIEGSYTTTHAPRTTTPFTEWLFGFPMRTCNRCTAWRAARDEEGRPICPANAPYDSKLDCCAVPHGAPLPGATDEERNRPYKPNHLRYSPSPRCIWWRAPRYDDGTTACPAHIPYESEFDCCAIPDFDSLPALPRCVERTPLRNSFGVPKCPESAPYLNTRNCCAFSTNLTMRGERELAEISPRCVIRPLARPPNAVPICPHFAAYEPAFDCCAIPEAVEMPDSADFVELKSPKCINWLTLVDVPQHNCPYYTLFNEKHNCCAIPAGSRMALTENESAKVARPSFALS